MKEVLKNERKLIVVSAVAITLAFTWFLWQADQIKNSKEKINEDLIPTRTPVTLHINK